MELYGQKDNGRIVYAGDFRSKEYAMEESEVDYDNWYSLAELQTMYFDILSYVRSEDALLTKGFPKHIVDYATEFLAQIESIDEANENQDHDLAFDIECDQRENGAAITSFILGK